MGIKKLGLWFFLPLVLLLLHLPPLRARKLTTIYTINTSDNAFQQEPSAAEEIKIGDREMLGKLTVTEHERVVVVNRKGGGGGRGGGGGGRGGGRGSRGGRRSSHAPVVIFPSHRKNSSNRGTQFCPSFLVLVVLAAAQYFA